MIREQENTPSGYYFFHVSGPVFFASDSSGNIASGGPCGVHVSFYNSPDLQRPGLPSLPFIFLQILWFIFYSHRKVRIDSNPNTLASRPKTEPANNIIVAFIYIYMYISAAILRWAGLRPPQLGACLLNIRNRNRLMISIFSSFSFPFFHFILYIVNANSSHLCSIC